MSKNNLSSEQQVGLQRPSPAKTNENHWFVALVRTKSELATAKQLEEQGICCYVPTQDELKVWRNGRKSHTKRLLLPGMVLVHCTEETRKTTVVKHYNVLRFMMNRAATPSLWGNTRIAVVPQKEIDLLKYLLGEASLLSSLVPQRFEYGTEVRITKYEFAGMYGEIIGHLHNNVFIVQLSILGDVQIHVDATFLERLH